MIWREVVYSNHLFVICMLVSPIYFSFPLKGISPCGEGGCGWNMTYILSLNTRIQQSKFWINRQLNFLKCEKRKWKIIWYNLWVILIKFNETSNHFQWQKSFLQQEHTNPYTDDDASFRYQSLQSPHNFISLHYLYLKSTHPLQTWH